MSKRKISATKITKRKQEQIPARRTPGPKRNKSHAAEQEFAAAPERAIESAAAGRKTKKQICINLLSRAEGATIREMEEATGWQAHSVRGFLSGEVRNRMNRQLVSEQNEDGGRRYRIVEAETAS